MSDDDLVFDFRSGVDEAEQAAQRRSFPKTHFFGIKDGESAVLRFLTEPTEWLTVDGHAAVPTKPKPDGVTGQWPGQMSATCRKDKALRGRFQDCFICDHMKKSNGERYRATPKQWAIALLREEVRENGRVVGLKTVLREEAKVDAEGKPTGEVEEVPAIVVVNMSWDHFFAPVSGYWRQFGSILNRDIKVTRKGAGMSDTSYTHVPLDPTPEFDLRDPEVAAFFAPYMPNLGKMITERATDDYFARYFDTRVVWTPKDRGNAQASSPSEGAPEDQQAKPSGDASSEKLASMRDRILGGTRS